MLHVTDSSYTTRTGLRMEPSEASIIDIGPPYPRGLLFTEPDLTPLPRPYRLLTNTEKLRNITLHPDGVRVYSAKISDPFFLQRKYLQVFEAYLDRAEKDPLNEAKYVEQGYEYLQRKAPELASKINIDTIFEQRRKSLDDELSSLSSNISVKDLQNNFMDVDDYKHSGSPIPSSVGRLDPERQLALEETLFVKTP